MTPLEMLKHHVSGAIERGEKEAIVEQAMTITAQELNDLAKQLWGVRMQTESSLEKSAIDVALAALLEMQERAKNMEAQISAAQPTK